MLINFYSFFVYLNSEILQRLLVLENFGNKSYLWFSPKISTPFPFKEYEPISSFCLENGFYFFCVEIRQVTIFGHCTFWYVFFGYKYACQSFTQRLLFLNDTCLTPKINLDSVFSGVCAMYTSEVLFVAKCSQRPHWHWSVCVTELRALLKDLEECKASLYVQESMYSLKKS